MQRPLSGRVVRTSVRMKTSPHKAWAAWADPQQIANWFVDRASGDARPGETMKWFFDTFGYAMDVPIVEAQPDRTFVSGSGAAPGPDGLPYLLEITIERDGTDTVMNLVNSGFSETPEKDDNFRGVESGWLMALATMKRWLERYPLLRRRHELIVRPAAFTWQTLRPLFAAADERARWLEPDIPASGEVLCDTNREVLMAWDAADAVIGLKAFSMGPQQMLALDASFWSANGDAPLHDAKARMTRALDRLNALLA